MSDRILFPLSNTAALGVDDMQWILLRASGSKSPRSDADKWRGVSFVRSTKAVLLRCIPEKGIYPDVEGRARLAALPDTFDQWKRQNDSAESIRRAGIRAEGFGALQRPEMAQASLRMSNESLRAIA
jgi:hypothetical protein